VSRICANSPFVLHFTSFHANNIGEFQPDRALPAGLDVVHYA
jgi:hypothetical protein